MSPADVATAKTRRKTTQPFYMKMVVSFFCQSVIECRDQNLVETDVPHLS